MIRLQIVGDIDPNVLELLLREAPIPTNAEGRPMYTPEAWVIYLCTARIHELVHNAIKKDENYGVRQRTEERFNTVRREADERRQGRLL